MKLRALRLKEVGPFSAPVAIEGLSDGLNILVGPNELGKSTLVRALRTLVESLHTSQAEAVRALRPYAGGAPLIEADLEIDGRLWRLRKRYLADRSATLATTDGGEIYRGADAEEHLKRLLAPLLAVTGLKGTGKSAGPAFGLVWVGQRESLDAPVPHDETVGRLQAFVQSQVEDVLGGDRARAVRALVEGDLKKLTGGRGADKPPAGSRRERAIKDLAAAELALAAAQAQAEAERQEIERLATCIAQREALFSPERRGELEAAVEVAEQGLAVAQAAEQQEAAAAARLEAESLKRDAARKALEYLERDMADLAKRHTQAAALDGEIGRLDEAATAARVQIETASEAHEAQRRRLDEGRAHRDAHARLVQAHAARTRQQALEHRLGLVRQAGQEQARLDAALAALPVTAERVERARSLSGALAVSEGRLSAAAPRVTVTYVPGAAGRINLAGRPLDDGEELRPDTPIRLEIPGVGTISVAPGGGSDLADLRHTRDSERKALDDMLARMTVTSLGEAQARLDARRDMEGERERARATVAALAPQGLEALEAEHAALTAEVSQFAGLAPGEPASGSADVLEAAVTAAERDLASRQAACERAREGVRAAEAALNGAREQRQRVGEEILQLEARLGAPEARQARVAELTKALADQVAAHAAAEREHRAVRSQVIDAARRREIEAEHARARAARQGADGRLKELEREINQLEGALGNRRESGRRADLDALTQSVRTLAAQVAGFAQEAAALDLLRRTFEAVERESRDRFLTPIIASARPYLTHIFGDGTLELGAAAEATALVRAGRAEPLDVVSMGTREQISILVRLGYARYLAEHGHAAPVVLDDPLVYADDQRIAGMFAALAEAARQHQVLVLTCRERAFADIAGHRLALTPWTEG